MKSWGWALREKLGSQNKDSAQKVNGEWHFNLLKTPCNFNFHGFSILVNLKGHIELIFYTELEQGARADLNSSCEAQQERQWSPVSTEVWAAPAEQTRDALNSAPSNRGESKSQAAKGSCRSFEKPDYKNWA